ncbi:SAM-dependent methyltransferase [Lampropedia cohaerens]|uniref:Release factor glutamine methyltransferase n=1 Tax=Lampropedia cohaerens TaxID=1610491 RepID=A0A0U1PWZ6_9BURK|nr:peptide chain release factor N(5)-glutamine methyltransferase [Lampropedia cohaerens]KKW67001.1 SAM-dependent methyltransferase [Lampropedia cohaerens]
MTVDSSPADEPSVADALRQACQQGLPRLEAQMLLLHALQRSPHERAWLVSHDQEPVATPTLLQYQALVHARLQGSPIAYLTGGREFYGLELHITPDVLDPRPDTEILVDWALELLAGKPAPRVLDLGTGSGAMALAIQHACPHAQVVAVERSPAALQVARTNAARHALPVRFLQGSWLQALEDAGEPGQFAVIVANPPYIADNDVHLAALQHEPRTALVAGDDGLQDLRTIIKQAAFWLQPNGWLLLEHGWQQHDAVRTMLADAGYAQIDFRRDLAGHVRCTGACRPRA